MLQSHTTVRNMKSKFMKRCDQMKKDLPATLKFTCSLIANYFESNNNKNNWKIPNGRN